MLREVALFEYLDADELAQLEAIAIQTSFPPNTIIFREGEDSDSLYIVLEGRAAAVCFDEEGKQILLNTFDKGDYFGEMSFFDGQSRCATIITKKHSRFLVIPRRDFLNVIASNPKMMQQLIKGLLEKLRKATKRIEEFAFMNVYARVTRFLTESQNEAGIVKEKHTHQDIADIVGASRETVSRIMRELTTAGYIQRKKGVIVLKKRLPYKF